ncbi:DNA-binding protein [Roseomonas sp. M0104]|uniref:DNA-binding protein n=1 Tax=Teichococcus coralli TaxID=2545983 RepID=A0A845BLE8_9PROT|nr:helix-turn-helix domain-containing protein [Pseudoroseomonas coralli]MXP66077.1 DNA-binding protein [Pseudoroseomonas coralli]
MNHRADPPPPRPDPGDRLLRLAEVATYLGTSPRTLRRWRAQGLIPVVRIGGSVRVRAADLERALAGPSDPAASGPETP